MILQQIYSGNDAPNFIRIATRFIKDITKNMLVPFSQTVILQQVLFNLLVDEHGCAGKTEIP